MKNLITAMALASTAFGQEVSNSIMFCFGRNVNGPIAETITAFGVAGSNEVEFVSEGETPNTMGRLYFGYESTLNAAQAALTPSPICLTGKLVASDVFVGDEFGTASITIQDMFLPGETIFVQRAHMSPPVAPTLNGAGSGIALKLRFTPLPPTPPVKR